MQADMNLHWSHGRFPSTDSGTAVFSYCPDHILSTGVIPNTWNPALITLAVASHSKIRLMLILTIAPGTEKRKNMMFLTLKVLN